MTRPKHTRGSEFQNTVAEMERSNHSQSGPLVQKKIQISSMHGRESQDISKLSVRIRTVWKPLINNDHNWHFTSLHTRRQR